MKLLLDTVTFLRATLKPAELSSRAAELLLDTDNDRYVSVVSSWEIGIKYTIGKLKLAQSPDRFIPEHRARLAAAILPLDEESVLHLLKLPPLHKDPFDRMLICQAMVHGMVLLTPDVRISLYPVRTIW